MGCSKSKVYNQSDISISAKKTEFEFIKTGPVTPGRLPPLKHEPKIKLPAIPANGREVKFHASESTLPKLEKKIPNKNKKNKPGRKEPDDVILESLSPRLEELPEVIEESFMKYTRFQQECLDSHNKYREKHGTPPLILSKKLCDMAQSHADKLAREKTFGHSAAKERSIPEGDVGENLAGSFTSDQETSPGDKIVSMWYEEVLNYDFMNPGYAIKTGHFTQVVWKNTVELGIGKAMYKSEDGWCAEIIVGRYFPAGNYKGEFEANVLLRCT